VQVDGPERPGRQRRGVGDAGTRPRLDLARLTAGDRNPAVDRERHDIPRAATAFIGDSAADLACAVEVGQCWMVANAEPELDGNRTEGSYGAGVAEVIERLLDVG